MNPAYRQSVQFPSNPSGCTLLYLNIVMILFEFPFRPLSAFGVQNPSRFIEPRKAIDKWCGEGGSLHVSTYGKGIDKEL